MQCKHTENQVVLQLNNEWYFFVSLPSAPRAKHCLQSIYCTCFWLSLSSFNLKMSDNLFPLFHHHDDHDHCSFRSHFCFFCLLKHFLFTVSLSCLSLSHVRLVFVSPPSCAMWFNTVLWFVNTASREIRSALVDSSCWCKYCRTVVV